MPDCEVGDTATVGAARVQGAITVYVAFVVVAALTLLLAVTLIVVAPMGADADDVTVQVDVLDAPDASVTDVGENALLHPLGAAGSVADSANVLLAQVAVSLFLTVTV